jgi:hypothetical protein
MQRGESFLRVCLSVGASFDEQAHDIRMTLGSRPHQRVLILRRLLRVDVGTARNQHANGVRVAAARARHDRCLTGGDACIRVRSGVEQELHERRTAIGASARERRHAEIVRDVGVGSLADQQVGDRHIVPMRRPQERGGPIVGPDVHVSLATEQGTNSRTVLRPGRFDEPEIICGLCGSGAHQQHEARCE